MFILKAIFYTPLYNFFVLILNIPHIDAGLAVILFTVVIRLALFPLSKKSILTQVRLKELEPEIAKIKEKYKDQKTQAEKLMALYKNKKINPFSGVLLLFIQIPIIISLYRIFYSGAAFNVDTSLLYSFIHAPQTINPHLLGFIDLSIKSVTIAVLVGVTQFIQARFQPLPKPNNSNGFDSPSFKNDFARSMNLQMKYFFPFLVTMISLKLPAVIGIYWITSNLFTIGQELNLKKHRVAIFDKEAPVEIVK